MLWSLQTKSANHQSLKTFGSFKARKIVNPVPFVRKTWPTYFTIEVPDIYITVFISIKMDILRKSRYMHKYLIIAYRFLLYWSGRNLEI